MPGWARPTSPPLCLPLCNLLFWGSPTALHDARVLWADGQRRRQLCLRHTAETTYRVLGHRRRYNNSSDLCLFLPTSWKSEESNRTSVKALIYVLKPIKQLQPLFCMLSHLCGVKHDYCYGYYQGAQSPICRNGWATEGIKRHQFGFKEKIAMRINFSVTVSHQVMADQCEVQNSLRDTQLYLNMEKWCLMFSTVRSQTVCSKPGWTPPTS